MLLHWPTGAVLSFSQLHYHVEENITPLSVGLMLNRRTSEDVIVEVTINNGSAKGIYVSDLLIVDLQDYLFYYFTAGIDYDISPPMKNNNVNLSYFTSDSDSWFWCYHGDY